MQSPPTPSALPNPLSALCTELLRESAAIPAKRKVLLQTLIDQIVADKKAGLPVAITVICTHNSRRSHIGQLWLQVAANWMGVTDISTFSGGTEATAFNPRAVRALQKAGFPIQQKTSGANPIYTCPLEKEEQASADLFSKRFDQAPNPPKDFLAILVCGEAAEACPYVPGAKARFYIPYKDPKAYDDQPEESSAYAEKVREIGREMLWVMDQVKRNLV